MKIIKADSERIYPRTHDKETVYLKNVVNSPDIIVGDFTIYNDFVHDPREFAENNVLYHYPIVNHDKLIIGKFCSVACGAKFLFNSANHSLKSLSSYPFPIFLKNGTCRWKLLRRHGITKVILLSAMMCGLAMKR